MLHIISLEHLVNVSEVNLYLSFLFVCFLQLSFIF